LVKEVGSGVNESRPNLVSLLSDQLMTQLVVEQKDRLSRFCFRFIETHLELQRRTMEVVNPADNHKTDLLHDLARIVYAICGGQNSAATCQSEKPRMDKRESRRAAHHQKA
jgi:putative resolvase